MAKKFVDMLALSAQITEKRETLTKIDILISREKKAECIKNFKKARDILVKEIDTMTKVFKKSNKSVSAKKAA